MRISLKQKKTHFNRLEMLRNELVCGGGVGTPSIFPTLCVTQHSLDGQDWGCRQGHPSFEWRLKLLPNLRCNRAVNSGCELVILFKLIFIGV